MKQGGMTTLELQAQNIVRDDDSDDVFEEEEEKKLTNLGASNDEVLRLKNRPLSKSNVISIENFIVINWRIVGGSGRAINM